MVTQEWRNGKWVDVGTPQELPENSRGKNFNDPRLNGAEKKPRGEVEIGAAIQDKIGAEIKLPPLKDQGGNLQGAEPEGMPPADEKPMLFPKQSELKAAHNRQRMLLTELKKLREQGKSTTQIERLIRDNKDKITIMESRLGNK
jgi:hypothetical protein